MPADLARHHLLGALAGAHQDCARLALRAAELSDFNPTAKAQSLARFSRHNREVTKIMNAVAIDIARHGELHPC